MSDGFKKKFEEAKKQIKKALDADPNAKDSFKRNSILSGMFSGAATGLLLTKHPLGGLAGGIIGGAAAAAGVNEVLNDEDGVTPGQQASKEPRKPKGRVPDPFGGLTKEDSKDSEEGANKKKKGKGKKGPGDGPLPS